MKDEIKNILLNTIENTQYMTKKRKEKFLKSNNYEKNIQDILTSKNEIEVEDIIKKLQNYEYDKNYRYFTLYESNLSNIKNEINKLKNTNNINTLEYDIINNFLDVPSIGIENEEEIDLKFSLKCKSNNSNDFIKYPVICTFFLNKNIVSIKYHYISEEFYKEEFYVNINNCAKKWIEDKMNLNLKEFDSKKIFKHIYKDVRNKRNDKNISVHSIRMDDELNGRTYFRATDNDALPFISQIEQLTETFENQNDKEKIKNFILNYEDEAIIRKLAIKWKNNFSNNKNGQLGSITVGIENAYSVNNDNGLKFEFIVHYVRQDESVNRERINYAIDYITKN